MSQITYEEAVTFTREDTGKRLCDSGDFYGRAYEQPPEPEEEVTCYGEPTDWYDFGINTTKLLADWFEPNEDLMQQYADHDEANDCCIDHMDQVIVFLESLGYERHLRRRDNTYNHEQDLTQQFVWEVLTHEFADEPIDWIWNNDDWHEVELPDGTTLPSRIVVVHVHTGCDVRSGYSRPLIGRFAGEYVVPLDLKVEWYVAEPEDHEANDNGWYTNGYGKHPRDEFTFLKAERDERGWWRVLGCENEYADVFKDGYDVLDSEDWPEHLDVFVLSPSAPYHGG